MTLEEERQELLEQFRKEYPDYDERFAKPGLGTHELSDRASIMADNWSDYIQDHPSCVAKEAWHKCAHEIMEKMANFYQMTALCEEQ